MTSKYLFLFDILLTGALSAFVVWMALIVAMVF